MILNNLLKELKKRLRRKRRRWLVLAFWILVVIASLSSIVKWNGNPDIAVFNPDGIIERDLMEQIVKQTEDRPVAMVKQYICGEEAEQLGMMNPQAILRLREEHPEAQITLDEFGVVVFTQFVNDLSARCKDNAYFGVDAAGNLTLFEGLPEENHVIRTFFQLNVQYLESKVETVQQLVQGIPVSDLSEYFSVLSTFSDYAIDDTEKAMKLQP